MKKTGIVNFYQAYKLYIFPIIIIISSIFLIVFAIYPQTIKLINNQKKSSDLANKLIFMDTKVSALESYNGEDLSQKLKIALSAYPSDKNYADILGLFQQLLAGSGFSITSIALGNTGAKLGSSDTFVVKLEIKGGKALLPDLLSNLENAPRLIKIDSIDVSTNNALQVVDVSLGIQVLYADAPKSFGATDSLTPQLTEKDEQLLTSLVRTGGAIPALKVRSARGKSNPFE